MSAHIVCTKKTSDFTFFFFLQSTFLSVPIAITMDLILFHFCPPPPLIDRLYFIFFSSPLLVTGMSRVPLPLEAYFERIGAAKSLLPPQGQNVGVGSSSVSMRFLRQLVILHMNCIFFFFRNPRYVVGRRVSICSKGRVRQAYPRFPWRVLLRAEQPFP